MSLKLSLSKFIQHLITASLAQNMPRRVWMGEFLVDAYAISLGQKVFDLKDLPEGSIMSEGKSCIDSISIPIDIISFLMKAQLPNENEQSAQAKSSQAPLKQDLSKLKLKMIRLLKFLLPAART